jgi:hypothetical protein
MGYSQGKMLKPEEIQNQNIISMESINEKVIYSLNDNYKIISKTNKKNVDCLIIEFINNENKQVDCEISLNRINFEEAYEMDLIFDSVITVFENMGINLPLVLYLNLENARINIFLKLESIEEIIVITNKFISLIKNFNKLMKFANDIDYKVHKKPEIQSNYSPLNNNNSYINCFANPNKLVNVNSFFNNVNTVNTNQSKILEKEKNNNTNNPIGNEISTKKEFIEFMTMNNNSNKKDIICNQKRILTFDNTTDIEKHAIEFINPFTNISNETLINTDQNKNNLEENYSPKEAEGAELPFFKSSNNLQNLKVIDKNNIENTHLKEENENKNEESEAQEKTFVHSNDISETIYLKERNEKIFENTDYIIEQPKEEADKLVNELLINKQTPAASKNLLLNENFFYSENTNNKLSFDESENFLNKINGNLTANKIVENTFDNKKIEYACYNEELIPKQSVGKFIKKMKFTFDETCIENENVPIKNQNSNNDSTNNFDINDKEKKSNEILHAKRILQKKDNVINQNYQKDSNKKPIISNNNESYNRNYSENNPFFNNSQNINVDVNSNNNLNNSKNQKKFNFPMQQDYQNDQINVPFTNNTQNQKILSMNNSNNYGDNINDINYQKTQNYYISNILNFNPNNNFSENAKMHDISNINVMMNPSLINHNMLMMMKKFNQNSVNNKIVNNNLLLNQTNGFADQNQVNNYNLLNINNNTAFQSNVYKTFTSNVNPQINDFNNKNYFINNNFNAYENSFFNNKINKIGKNNEFKIAKESEEKDEYLEEKIKLISLEEEILEGFYFKNSDYISDEDFISFYFLGNLISLTENLITNNKSEIEIRECFSSILSNYFKENFNLKLKHIIQNPSESDSISRLVFYRNNQLDNVEILTEVDGLEHKKIKIKNQSFILIRIKSLVLKLHPEELYVDLQLKVNYEINNFDERDFVNFLENSLKISFFEISFITEGECVLTFYEKESLKEFMNLIQQKPYQQIKRPLKKVKIVFSILKEPFPIQGNTINILYEEDENEKAEFPQRPPACIKVLAGNYTPSLKKLLSTKNMWSGFRIEINNFEVITVEEFYNELSKSDFGKFKLAYAENPKNIEFTILNYSKKQKKKLKQIIDDKENDNESALRESNKLNSDKAIIISNSNNNQKSFSNRKILNDEISSDEAEFSSKPESESSFSMRNIQDSDLDLDDNNPKFNKTLTSEKQEIKIHKKRGRKPKSELIEQEYQRILDRKSNLHPNDYGKKLINNFRRSYNHSRYTVSNLQLESSIDTSKPNFLDQIIEIDLDAREKKLLQKLEKEVEYKIFNKNSNTNDFLPRKRGRKVKAENLFKDSSEKQNYYEDYNSNNILLEERTNKRNNYLKLLDSENKIDADCNINVLKSGERQINYLDYLETHNETFDEKTNEDLKSKCIDEEMINKILSRKDDCKLELDQ